MINLTKAATQNIYLTLTEMQLLTAPNYLFRFINRSSNEEVKFVLLNATDTSLFKDRYNKFSIVTDTYFSSSVNGMYIYEIYEEAGTGTNITGLNLLESGIMMLNSPSTIFTNYTTTDTYKIRQ
jgi:hypothetical protein